MEELIISNLRAKVLWGEKNEDELEKYYDSICECENWIDRKSNTCYGIKILFALVELNIEHERPKYECFIIGYKGTLEESFGKDYEKLSQWLDKTIAWSHDEAPTSYKLKSILDAQSEKLLKSNAQYLYTSEYNARVSLCCSTDDLQIID